jgi:Ig-like domain-containing protein
VEKTAMQRDDDSDQQPPEPKPPIRGGNAAMFVTMPRTLPQSLLAGRRYDVAVTMRNTGTTTWRAEGDQPHRLGSQNPRDNTQWGFGRIDVPADVAPGDEVTFAFSVAAPEAPGLYHFQWRMIQDGVSWFGEPSQDVVVQVDGLPGESLPPFDYSSPNLVNDSDNDCPDIA